MVKQLKLYGDILEVLGMLIRDCRRMKFTPCELTKTAVFSHAHLWIEHLLEHIGDFVSNHFKNLHKHTDTLSFIYKVILLKSTIM